MSGISIFCRTQLFYGSNLTSPNRNFLFKFRFFDKFPSLQLPRLRHVKFLFSTSSKLTPRYMSWNAAFQSRYFTTRYFRSYISSWTSKFIEENGSKDREWPWDPSRNSTAACESSGKPSGLWPCWPERSSSHEESPRYDPDNRTMFSSAM